VSAGSQAIPRRALRASLFSGERAPNAPSVGVSTPAYCLALLAVFVEFVISGNTLNLLGIPYNQLGGNPLVKFHPATYLAVIAAIVALAAGSSRGRGLGHLLSKAPALLVFGAVIIFCTVFATVNVGVTGAGIYIDTYLSAGALAVVMVDADARQRRILARLVLALCVMNVLISLAEYVHKEHFIPLEIQTGDGKLVTDDGTDEFRPAALYGHSLSGAMATAFGVFLLLSMRLRFATAAICFGIFAVGLLGFGGRAALGVTLGLLALRVTVTFARDFMRGRVNGRLLATVLLSALVLGPLAAYLLTDTPVGERIAARSYYDDSAEVRTDQWQVFGKLTPNQAMFGTPATDLQQIYDQVGLAGVENPFILVFLNLGIVGSPIFAFGLIAYFFYLGRAYPESRWLLFAAILILSGSNSIGTKSADLVMMTACAVTMRGQLGRHPLRVLRTLPAQSVFPHLRPKGLTQEAQIPEANVSSARPNRGLSSDVVQR
jgi:hypothetical protein